MDLPRIIFVDGLPGSGKSTTAQRLSLHLRRQGYRARWIFEHEEPHPLFSDERVRALREQSSEADHTLFETALAGYRELARIARNPTADIVLIDGSLFQAAAGTQFLLDKSPAEIDAFFDQTITALAPHSIALIYLQAEDEEAALQRTASDRGDWFPQFVISHLAATPLGQKLEVNSWPDALAVLQQHSRQSQRLFNRFPGRKLQVDPTSGDWGNINDEITQFLGLTPMLEPPTETDLSLLEGRYQAEGGDDIWEFRSLSGELHLVGPPSSRLWSRPEGGFEISGMAVELTFELSDEGPARYLNCAPRLKQLPLRWNRI